MSQSMQLFMFYLYISKLMCSLTPQLTKNISMASNWRLFSIIILLTLLSYMFFSIKSACLCMFYHSKAIANHVTPWSTESFKIKQACYYNDDCSIICSRVTDHYQYRRKIYFRYCESFALEFLIFFSKCFLRGACIMMYVVIRRVKHYCVFNMINISPCM